MKPFLALLVAITMLSACKKDVQRNNSSNVPSEFLGRATDIQDEIALSSRNVSISVWDHGTIDGDIVSVYVNGRKVVDEVTLDGPDNKFVVNTTLDFNGYNYILLHAHNETKTSAIADVLFLYKSHYTSYCFLVSTSFINLIKPLKYVC